jgi:hypothetical protein
VHTNIGGDPEEVVGTRSGSIQRDARLVELEIIRVPGIIAQAVRQTTLNTTGPDLTGGIESDEAKIYVAKALGVGESGLSLRGSRRQTDQATRGRHPEGIPDGGESEHIIDVSVVSPCGPVERDGLSEGRKSRTNQAWEKRCKNPDDAAPRAVGVDLKPALPPLGKRRAGLIDPDKRNARWP